jgi:hypothetical protein
MLRDMVLVLDVPDVPTNKTRVGLCSAAALQGKSVFVFDPNSFYGGFGATLNLSKFMDWYARNDAAEEVRCEGKTTRSQHTSQSQPLPAQAVATSPTSTPVGKMDFPDEHVKSSQSVFGGIPKVPVVSEAQCEEPCGAGSGSWLPNGKQQPDGDTKGGAHRVSMSQKASVAALPSSVMDGSDAPAASLDGEACMAVPLKLPEDGVHGICAHVQLARVPGRDNDYCIDLAHQVSHAPHLYAQPALVM